MTQHTFYSLLLSVLVFLGATACGPVTTEPDSKETDSSKDNSFSQNEFDAIAQAFDAEASNSGLLNKTEGTASYFCSCATSDIVDNQNGTYTLTVDFGTGCFCLDGRKREGKLTGIFSGKWNEPGTSVVITPENYAVTALSGRRYTFDFTKTMTYQGLNGSGNRLYHTVINNATLTDPDNTVLAVYGVASLFGFLKISEMLPLIEGAVKGRLLMFFPGVYEQNNYRLLDARDGWNYHAFPITASDVEART